MIMRKCTKIVATLSDMRCTQEFLSDLSQAGVDVVRLNSAHQSVESCRRVICFIREHFPSLGILVDTKGPEMRTSALGESLQVNTRDVILVRGNPEGESQGSELYVNSRAIEGVPLGSSILIDDGELELIVIGVQPDGALRCCAQQAGEIKPRKSVNVPNVPIDLPAVSAKDKEFIALASELDVDFIAHSFVRTAADVQAVQAEIERHGGTCKVVAKIENQQGVDHIDHILQYAYGVMVARGDLGIEISAERVPVVQRQIVKKCIRMRRPVIIATQMLHSMIDSPRATRAEISDVANAIFQQSDAIMLSGETAYGKYPMEAVKLMVRIAREVEGQLTLDSDLDLIRVKTRITETLCRAAVQACQTLPIKAIVIDTLSGRTARYLAAFRGRVPVFAMCYDQKVERTLTLSYGIEPMYMELHASHDHFVHESVSRLLEQGEFAPDDLILIIAGSFGASNGASFMEISQASNILRKSFP